jgi:hypothetical protein
MLLVISPEGLVRGIYDEALDYGALGAVEIQRASRVDPDEMQAWWADLGIVVSVPRTASSIRRLNLSRWRHRVQKEMSDGQRATAGPKA